MITLNEASFERFNFPSGETHIKILTIWDPATFTLDWEYENDSEFIELALLADTLRRDDPKREIFLNLPYVPFSRQDRVTSKEEPFSLKVFCNLINSLKFDKVFIYDPHSDVTTALLDKCIVLDNLPHVFDSLYREKDEFHLISPDAGSLKKIYKLASSLGDTGIIDRDKINIVECSKKRDIKTGEVSETTVHLDDFSGKDCYILDDICDGGRTFIEIARIIKTRNCGKITLFVTHGFFTKGMSVFEGLIDEIYTRQGRVK